jgi:hypothetical protein
MPTNFIFFPDGNIQPQQQTIPMASNNPSLHPPSNPPPLKIDSKAIEANLKSSLNKIEGFVDMLEHPQNYTELER